MHRLASLNRIVVRDLAYACFDQPLIKDFNKFIPPDNFSAITVPRCCHLQLTAARWQWLKKLDQQPQALIDHLAAYCSNRLGYYYEALWHFFIQTDPMLELIAHNQTLYYQKITLGELDILYRCKQCEKVYHLELAIKFYLQTGKHSNDIQYYYGASQRDRLDKKLHKLLFKQSQLCIHQTVETRSPYFNQAIYNEIALYGYLFYPLEQHQPCSLVNPQHRQGKWLPLFKLKQILQHYNFWTALPRLAWISPTLKTVDDIYCRERFYDYVNHTIHSVDSCLMVAALAASKQGYIEQQRYIITPDNWADKLLIT